MHPEEGEKYMYRRKQKECAEHRQKDRRDQRKKIAGIREKRSQGSDGRIASLVGKK
jgi:hypothetical protein